MGAGGNARAAVGAVLVAGMLAVGCGSDDEKAAKTVTETVTQTETVATPETTETTAPKPPTQPKPQTGGESADLPLCSAGPPPCRDTKGNVVKPQRSGGAAAGPGSGGEASDLPLCSQGPRPCRDSSGKVLEP